MSKNTEASASAGLPDEQKASNEENTNLSESNQTAEEIVPLKIPEDPISVNGMDYKFNVASFIFNRMVYSSEELAADPESEKTQEVLRALLELEGQGILRPDRNYNRSR